MTKFSCKISILICCILIVSACNSVKSSSHGAQNQTGPENLLFNINEDQIGNFKWMNKPKSVETVNGIMSVTVDENTDFFIDPVTGESTASAPLLYQEVVGDFVATALVEPDFSSKWNAGALMVVIDEDNWIKFAFENSDATGRSIVSVVTKNVSDDANGVIIEEHDKIWLRMIRKGDIYSMHWSLDGSTYFMARLTKMPSANAVKLGLEAQVPVGKSATHKFHYFGVEARSVEDLRAGA